MLVNRRLVRIEWGDCDPAGIVYYPRYFAMFDASTTALIERALGMSKYDYLKAYDFAGRVISTTDADGNNTAYAYDGAGNLINRTDANGPTINT